MVRIPYRFFFLAFVTWTTGLTLLGKVKIETSFDPPTITSANQSTYKVVVHIKMISVLSRGLNSPPPLLC